MPNAAFVVNLEVENINLEALAGLAGTIEDACEHAGLEVLYVHPYQRRFDDAQPFVPPGQNLAGGLPAVTQTQNENTNE